MSSSDFIQSVRNRHRRNRYEDRCVYDGCRMPCDAKMVLDEMDKSEQERDTEMCRADIAQRQLDESTVVIGDLRQEIEGLTIIVGAQEDTVRSLKIELALAQAAAAAFREIIIDMQPMPGEWKFQSVTDAGETFLGQLEYLKNKIRDKLPEEYFV